MVMMMMMMTTTTTIMTTTTTTSTTTTKMTTTLIISTQGFKSYCMNYITKDATGAPNGPALFGFTRWFICVYVLWYDISLVVCAV